MTQIPKNLTGPIDGFLLGKTYLIFDRDTQESRASSAAEYLHHAGDGSAAVAGYVRLVTCAEVQRRL